MHDRPGEAHWFLGKCFVFKIEILKPIGLVYGCALFCCRISISCFFINDDDADDHNNNYNDDNNNNNDNDNDNDHNNNHVLVHHCGLLVLSICLCPWLPRLNNRFRHSETGLSWFYNHSSPWMFLPLDLPLEYWIDNVMSNVLLVFGAVD